MVHALVALLLLAAPPPAAATPAPVRDGGVPAPVAPAAPAAVSPPAGVGFPDGGIPSPSLATSRIAEGDRLMQDRRYRDAAFAYLDASNADPSSIEALFKLANAFAVLGYYEQAILDWNRVAELTQDPAIRRNAQDNVSRAQARIAQLGGGSPQAQNLPPGSGPIAETTKQKARAAYEAGVAQVNARDYAGGAQTLGSAISLDPTMAVAYVARGSAFVGLKRYSDALADYRYAARLDPSSASPLYGIAECYRALGRSADARAYYERYAGSTAADVRPAVQEDARKKAERLR